MSVIDTNLIKEDEPKLDAEGRIVMRFEAFVNHKRQGILIAARSTSEEYQKTKEKFAYWKFEGDPYPNKTYSCSDDAIIALCEKTGRKLKFDKDGKLKKR